MKGQGGVQKHQTAGITSRLAVETGIRPQPSFLLATSVTDGNFKKEWWVLGSLMTNRYHQSTNTIKSISRKVKNNNQIWSTVLFVVEKCPRWLDEHIQTPYICALSHRGDFTALSPFSKRAGFMLNSAGEQQGRTPISGGICTNLTGPLCREVYWPPSNGANMSFGNK